VIQSVIGWLLMAVPGGCEMMHTASPMVIILEETGCIPALLIMQMPLRGMMAGARVVTVPTFALRTLVVELISWLCTYKLQVPLTVIGITDRAIGATLALEAEIMAQLIHIGQQLLMLSTWSLCIPEVHNLFRGPIILGSRCTPFSAAARTIAILLSVLLTGVP
jgi:hypothetical protein